MAKGIVKLCEVGVLLSKGEKEFDFYNTGWSEKYGFYDENSVLYKEENVQDAIQYAKSYVKDGVDMTYAIVTDEGECRWEEPFDNGDMEIISENYNVADVLYCVAKINGEIVEDFLHK